MPPASGSAVHPQSPQTAANHLEYAKNGCPGDVHTIDYDATGSVAGFDSNSATAVTYDERHLARTMGSRKLTYDLQGRLINERIGDVDNQYFWDGDELIFFITTLAGWYNIGHAVATDHLGAPWRAWAGTSTSWSVSYEPFGRVTPEDGATSFSPTPAIAVRRPGQIADSVSGLYQNWWRQYDNRSGRYGSVDPLVGRAKGLPPYSYALANPLRYVDPLGLTVKNNSNKVIWMKPETPGEPWRPVQPGDTDPGSPDGVETESDKKAYYGKDWLPDNDVEVDEDGNIECVGGLCSVLPDKPWPDKDDHPDWDYPGYCQ